MSFQNKRLLGIVAAVVLLLTAVYAAMRLSGNVKWSGFDFALAGVLMLATGLAIEMVLRLVQKTTHRLAICAGILFLLVIVWAELAVGLFGSPLAGS